MMSVALASRSNLELIAQKGKLVKIRFDSEAMLSGVSFDELLLSSSVLQDVY